MPPPAPGPTIEFSIQWLGCDTVVIAVGGMSLSAGFDSEWTRQIIVAIFWTPLSKEWAAEERKIIHIFCSRRARIN